MTPPPKKPAAAKRAGPRRPTKKVRVSESGHAAAVQTGTSDREVAEVLTGADQLPGMGMELGRPPGRPEFDPRAQVEVEEPIVTPIVTAVFVAVSDDDIENRVKQVIAYAEAMGLVYLTATVGQLDDAALDILSG
jgi:hypothetical protein